VADLEAEVRLNYSHNHHKSGWKIHNIPILDVRTCSCQDDNSEEKVLPQYPRCLMWLVCKWMG